MTAKVRNAVLLGDWEARRAYLALGAAAVDDDRVLVDLCRVIFEPFDRRRGSDGQQDDIALCHRLVRQRLVHRAADDGERQDIAIDVVGEYTLARPVVCLGERAADQAEADDAGGHSATAFLTRRTALARSSYCSGRRDCAPSHSA